jgi:hypothetical protein
MTEFDEIRNREYSALKAEQGTRIGFRDGLLGGGLAAAFAVAYAAHGHIALLLLAPAVTFTVGWTYLRNDHMISAIGRYLREKHPAAGWEKEHPLDRRRRSRMVIQLAVDLTAFCLSALVALTAFWLAPEPNLLLAASAAEAAATGVLAWQFVMYSGLTPAEKKAHPSGRAAQS